MPLPSLAVWIVVLCIGLPSMLKNWTAVALVASWLIGVAWKQATGEGFPLQLEIVRDYMVLIVIFLKAPDKKGEPSPGALGWAKDWWLELSRWDKAVICLFAPMWFTYAVPLDPQAAYWISWGAGIAQFVAAGAEAVERWRRGRVQTKAHDPTDLSMRRYGLVGHGC